MPGRDRLRLDGRRAVGEHLLAQGARARLAPSSRSRLAWARSSRGPSPVSARAATDCSAHAARSSSSIQANRTSSAAGSASGGGVPVGRAFGRGAGGFQTEVGAVPAGRSHPLGAGSVEVAGDQVQVIARATAGHPHIHPGRTGVPVENEHAGVGGLALHGVDGPGVAETTATLRPGSGSGELLGRVVKSRRGYPIYSLLSNTLRYQFYGPVWGGAAEGRAALREPCTRHARWRPNVRRLPSGCRPWFGVAVDWRDATARRRTAYYGGNSIVFPQTIIEKHHYISCTAGFEVKVGSTAPRSRRRATAAVRSPAEQYVSRDSSAPESVAKRELSSRLSTSSTRTSPRRDIRELGRRLQQANARGSRRRI